MPRTGLTRTRAQRRGFCTAVVFGVIQAVTHHELVRDLEAHIGHVHRPQPPAGLVQQGGDAQGARPPLLQHVDEIVQRHAAVDDVLDHQHVRALDGAVEVLGQPHLARGGLALAIRGNADEVDARRLPHRARQVGQEEAGAFENGHQPHAVRVIFVDLRAELADPALDRLGRQKDTQGSISARHGVSRRR